MPSIYSEISRLLQAWSQGDEAARDRVIPMVFEELRRLAEIQFRREPQDHTLEPTAVVNELYLRLVQQKSVRLENRREFFAIAAQLIRRILVDHARKRRASKRGGGGPKIPLEDSLGLSTGQDPELIALDDALNDLASHDPRGHRVVELHIFGGLTFEEVATELGIGRATVVRDWNHARLWLNRHMQEKQRNL